MQFTKNLTFLTLLHLTIALPNPQPQTTAAPTTTNNTNAIDGIIAALTASSRTVCNCANMQGIDLFKALVGINQCTIQISGYTSKCTLDSDSSLGYECPQLNGTPNCNFCAQSLDSDRLATGNVCPGTPPQGNFN